MAGSGNMQDIKRRVRSVTSIEHITNAMKLVSAAKLRRAKLMLEKTQRYFKYVTDAIREVLANTEDVPTTYLSGDREIKKTCYIVVTSNRGLAGSFSANVIKQTLLAMQERDSEAVIVSVGSKGRDYFRRRNYEMASEHLLPPENITFVETREISKPILEQFEQGEIDEVVLVYTSFISPLEQRAKQVRLLPFEIDQNIEQKEASAASSSTKKEIRQVEYEPSAEAVFDYLIPKYVEIMFFGAIIESATCEHAARRVAMESATDNAHDMISDLNLTFNRARQAAITREITEIVSGADALN
ncbi:MAG: ATP synthase F1 subunit gamma [Clostridiales Family XIII bacterium]|jgi:F-type H+-transporting ATPase subunit gamma|nr:ATP synthase F1 subunit gamma [Clostridiales Family XIII bacterium]